MLKNVIAMIIAIAVGAIGYRFWIRKDAEESPLNVMVTQMRTRAIIEHERHVTVWYKACPEVPGVNPQVMVIWPAKLNYELDLAETKLSLGADGVLHVKTPPARFQSSVFPSIVTFPGAGRARIPRFSVSVACATVTMHNTLASKTHIVALFNLIVIFRKIFRRPQRGHDNASFKLGAVVR